MPRTYELRVDLGATLAEQPLSGHNRWHPGIEALVHIASGDRVVLQMRDALDLQFGRHASLASVATVDLNLVHPLTGPVYVDEAEPGDLLEVRILDLEPDTYGFSAQIPGFGFLRDHFPDPFLVQWTITDGYATSPQIPGLAIPGAPFPGIVGLAPSHELLGAIVRRERADAERGGMVVEPDPAGAVPSDQRIATEALRTIAPHEVGGNIDIKQLTAGSTLFLPVSVPGALLSAGDGHFAQGDGEVCGTAIEMSGTLHLELHLHKGRAIQRGITTLQFSSDRPTGPPAGPYFATTGLSVSAAGESRAEDLGLSAENALLAMIEHLGAEYGYSAQQAYAICSVAVDLKVSQVVDVPNFIVSAVLPLSIFVG
ncbi:MAG: acetamidase/formamidase family protein [Acidimicrobiales bacterium]